MAEINTFVLCYKLNRYTQCNVQMGVVKCIFPQDADIWPVSEWFCNWVSSYFMAAMIMVFYVIAWCSLEYFI